MFFRALKPNLNVQSDSTRAPNKWEQMEIQASALTARIVIRKCIPFRSLE